MIAQFMEQRRHLPALDGQLLLSAAALAVIGLIMVASSSFAISEGSGRATFYYLNRHGLAMTLGLGLAVGAYHLPLDWLQRHSTHMLLLALTLLLAVFLPGIGVTVNGAQRWVRLGPLNFQMVEAVKLLLVIWLAGYCVRHADALRGSWMGVLKPVAVGGLLAAALIAQPDFGGAALILGIVFGLLYLAGAEAIRLGILLGLGAPAVIMVAIIEPYRVQRLLTFLDPWQNQFGEGYQLVQSLIAIGRGEWFGVGLGEGVQKLYYLPEAHTDFILAIIAEEFGFVGVLCVLLLYVWFAGRAFAIGQQAVDKGRTYAAYIAYGIALWFSMQALVSIGVNLGALPTKGLTLPLISSGGSSVMMSLAAIGLLLRVSGETRLSRDQLAARGGAR